MCKHHIMNTFGELKVGFNALLISNTKRRGVIDFTFRTLHSRRNSLRYPRTV
jgi:hypothetical protein